MKRITIFSFASAIFVLASCGAAKQAQKHYPDQSGYENQLIHYQQAQSGIYQNQQSVYQQQYQSQPGPDAAGFIEIKKSPIEELSLAVGTNEIRAYGQAESGNEQMAFNAARAQATAALQEKIEVYVRTGLDIYIYSRDRRECRVCPGRVYP